MSARYAVVIEGTPGTNCSAYAPDLPGCVATGDAVESCAATMAEAIAFHLEGLRLAGEHVPDSTVVAVTMVDVA